jgi:hypothetical protein
MKIKLFKNKCLKTMKIKLFKNKCLKTMKNIHSFGLVLNPRNLGPVASTITIAPPRTATLW